eukprot:scaffold8450_cov179-Ochromonas_danica.AAC.4
MTGPTTTAKQDVWFVLEGKMCAWCVSIKFMMMVVTIVIAFILHDVAKEDDECCCGSPSSLNLDSELYVVYYRSMSYSSAFDPLDLV